MSICCDNSVSCEESRGEENFFAIKKVYEGSFDGETWYKAGDIVYYGSKKKRMLKSVILEVEYDGSILVENEKGIFSCSVKEMESGQIIFEEACSNCPGSLLAVRYRVQFTIDLHNWFSVDQSCIIETSNVTYVGAMIEGLFCNGNILISCDDKEENLHYSEIINIKDFLDNTRYLVLKKNQRESLPDVQRNATHEIKCCLR